MKEQLSQYLNGRTDNIHLVLKANDRSYFAILKKEIHALALTGGFSDRKIGEIDVVVAELVSNLIKHAGGGDLYVKLVKENGIQGIEIISIDNGPGIPDVNKMLSDGVSTKNTLGIGLGSMKRLSNYFQVYSTKDWGTILLCRIFEKAEPSFLKPSKIEIRSFVFPKPGEQSCGDGFFYKSDAHYVRLFLGDGLGHGPEASKAVQAAGQAFLHCPDNDPSDMIRYIDVYVRKTRGLVGTIAVFDIKEKKWRICGVGNIMTKLGGPTVVKNYLAYNGIIGLNVPRTLNTQVIDYEKGQQIIFCSDGIKSRWDLLKYPGLFRYDLSIMAAIIVKDFGRFNDDTSVAVCKINI